MFLPQVRIYLFSGLFVPSFINLLISFGELPFHLTVIITMGPVFHDGDDVGAWCRNVLTPETLRPRGSETLDSYCYYYTRVT